MTYTVEFATSLCVDGELLPQQQHANFLRRASVELGANPYAAGTTLRNLLGYSVIFMAKKYHIVFRVEGASKALIIVMMSLDPGVFNLALRQNTPQ